MPPSRRHGSWHFQTLWAIPASIHITNADTSDSCLVVVDDVLTRDLLECGTHPPYLGSVQLKYKYSDLRFAFSTPPRSLPLTGYIQSKKNRPVDIDMLLRWLPATWSPVAATARARRISIYIENVATARAVGNYRYTSRLSMYIDAAEQWG